MKCQLNDIPEHGEPAGRVQNANLARSFRVVFLTDFADSGEELLHNALHVVQPHVLYVNATQCPRVFLHRAHVGPAKLNLPHVMPNHGRDTNFLKPLQLEKARPFVVSNLLPAQVDAAVKVRIASFDLIIVGVRLKDERVYLFSLPPGHSHRPALLSRSWGVVLRTLDESRRNCLLQGIRVNRGFALLVTLQDNVEGPSFPFFGKQGGKGKGYEGYGIEQKADDKTLLGRH
mmetsp:Transcript_5370/g.10721  ORF Transcript_5370/g.10721 Transcript_5370/m.10721 type:complete len:231 (+) Transcript_5370:481-1173(+)